MNRKRDGLWWYRFEVNRSIISLCRPSSSFFTSVVYVYSRGRDGRHDLDDTSLLLTWINLTAVQPREYTQQKLTEVKYNDGRKVIRLIIYSSISCQAGRRYTLLLTVVNYLLLRLRPACLILECGLTEYWTQVNGMSFVYSRVYRRRLSLCPVSVKSIKYQRMRRR